VGLFGKEEKMECRFEENGFPQGGGAGRPGEKGTWGGGGGSAETLFFQGGHSKRSHAQEGGGAVRLSGGAALSVLNIPLLSRIATI